MRDADDEAPPEDMTAGGPADERRPDVADPDGTHRGAADPDVTGVDAGGADWPDDTTPDTSVGRRSSAMRAAMSGRSMDELRETYREQMLANIGGWSGALITAIPTTVFVIVNVITTLRIAIVAAVGSALVLAGYRFVRKQPVQQALSGLFGVLIAAIIAARTGEARGYFLVGIITSFLYAVPFGVSIVVRRPLVGLIWEFLDPTPGVGARSDDSTTVGNNDSNPGGPRPQPWYRVRPLLVAYTASTLAATLVFLLRGIVQLILYRRNDTGWLAVARIAMGYPLFVAAIAFGLLVVRNARKKVVTVEPD